MQAKIEDKLFIFLDRYEKKLREESATDALSDGNTSLGKDFYFSDPMRRRFNVINHLTLASTK